MLKKFCLSLVLVTSVWGAPQPNVLKGQVKDWHATAQIERTLNGQKYVFALHPDSDDVFAGNLVDGSAGKTIAGALQRTSDGDAIADVPVARYKITARYLDSDNADPLLVRVRNQGEFGPQVVADFKVITTTVHHIEVEVKSP